MKKNSLANSRLYAVLSPEDAAAIGLAPEDAARQAILGGADLIQLRDKRSDDQTLLKLALRVSGAVHELGGLFIVNDRPDIARGSEADGVHLGQDDLAHADARRALGPDFIIGRSTHSLDQALRAEAEGADYIGYGPIYTTPTKPDYGAVGPESIREIADRVSVPFFAIGGIDSLRLGTVARCGARRIAVVRAAFANRNVFESVRRLKKELMKHDGVHSV